MASEALVLVDEATQERFEFPVNPAEISVSMGRSFVEVPVINLDSVLHAGNLTPVGLSWDGFFPVVYDSSICNYPPESPEDSIRRIEKWLGRVGEIQVKPTPVRVVVTGTYFSRMMVISDFSTEFRGGEPGDVYYSITLQSWRLATISIESPASPVGASTSDRPKVATPTRTYVVRKGDFLWLIAQSFYGDGKKWPTIYDANKALIGSNPNLILPGQVLVVP